MSFLKYIHSLRELAKNSENKIFVLGNSGADYDSIFGSMIYAFFMTNYIQILHLPLIDCPQSDILLRFQVDFVLKQYGITSKHLLYTQMFKDLYTNKNSMFLLYDHNFRKEVSKNQIVQIIDHHAIVEQILCPHIIETCGSALTLLYYLYNPDKLEQFKESSLNRKFQIYRNSIRGSLNKVEQYDTTIDELLYYGIMLDTFKLNPTQKGRWNQYDLSATEDIVRKVKPKLMIIEIQAVKTSLEYALGLNLSDHMRKDYKAINYGRFTIKYSVILMNPKFFIQKYWDELMLKYPSERMDDHIVNILMFAYTDELSKLKRQMVFSGKNQEFLSTIEKLLESNDMIKQQNLGQWKRWEDPTTLVSRKLFDSLLKACI